MASFVGFFSSKLQYDLLSVLNLWKMFTNDNSGFFPVVYYFKMRRVYSVDKRKVGLTYNCFTEISSL